MKRIIPFIAALVLAPFLALAQPFIWQGVPGQVAPYAFSLDPAWSGTATITAYYSEGGQKVPDRLQPSFTRSGNTLSAQFSAAATAALPQKTFITVATGGTLRLTGYLVLSATPLTSNPTGLDAALALKVDKVLGKALSTNDFTNVYKARLDSVSYRFALFQSLLDGKAATSHTHSASAITSGTFAPARYGTGTIPISALNGDLSDIARTAVLGQEATFVDIVTATSDFQVNGTLDAEGGAYFAGPATFEGGAVFRAAPTTFSSASQFNGAVTLTGGITINSGTNTINSATTFSAPTTFNNNVTLANGFSATYMQLSSLNTAPSSASASGVVGQIRWTSTHLYLCVAPNTWVRASFSTW